MVIRPHQRCR